MTPNHVGMIIERLRSTVGRKQLPASRFPLPALTLIIVAVALVSCSKEPAAPAEESAAAPYMPSADSLERAKLLAQKMLIVDTHVDVPYRLETEWEDVSQRTEKGHFDFVRATEGGLNVPFMSIYVAWRYQDGALGGAYEQGNNLIDAVEKIAGQSPDKFAIAYSTDDVWQQFANGIISFPMGMENGAPIGNDLANLEHFYGRGIRYITLTHSKVNQISDSSYDLDNRPWDGLSAFGVDVVKEMNRLGIMIDISHLSDAAANDTLDATEAPVIASHSSARAFTPGWERNISDEIIERVADNDGVVQINFGSAFVNPEANLWSQEYFAIWDAFVEENGYYGHEQEVKDFGKAYKKENPPPPSYLSDVLDHYDHVVELVGIDYVGIGSDYDGVENVPVGLEDTSTYPNLIAGLLERSYSEEDIEKILGGNLMRVWKAVEDHAAASQ